MGARISRLSDFSSTVSLAGGFVLVRACAPTHNSTRRSELNIVELIFITLGPSFPKFVNCVQEAEIARDGHEWSMPSLPQPRAGLPILLLPHHHKAALRSMEIDDRHGHPPRERSPGRARPPQDAPPSIF
jgi:hypothetical protein